MSAQRIVVVTGGASGIGRATADRFAAAGDRVVLADVNIDMGEKAAQEIGAGCSFRRLDVSDGAAVEVFAGEVEDEVGPVSVLVNSAGLLQNKETVDKMPLAEHERIWAVNYRSTYLMCRAFGRPTAQEELPPNLASQPVGGAQLHPIPEPRLNSTSHTRLLARIYEVLPLLCPSCQGGMCLISFLTDTPTVRSILLHLGIPDRPPPHSPPRAPPQAEIDLDQTPAVYPTNTDTIPEFDLDVDQYIPPEWDS
jgi:hypothetical protein